RTYSHKVLLDIGRNKLLEFNSKLGEELGVCSLLKRPTPPPTPLLHLTHSGDALSGAIGSRRGKTIVFRLTWLIYSVPEFHAVQIKQLTCYRADRALADPVTPPSSNLLIISAMGLITGGDEPIGWRWQIWWDGV
ncbi:hypothetical protein NFI96_018015, partial [Prochilodus magdalenae]